MGRNIKLDTRYVIRDDNHRELMVIKNYIEFPNADDVKIDITPIVDEIGHRTGCYVAFRIKFRENGAILGGDL